MGSKAYLILAAALAPLVFASLGGGCGSTVNFTTSSSSSAGDGGGGGFIFLNGGGGTRPDGGGAGDALPDYDDPGCKDQPPPIEDYQCDAYNQGNGDCLPGEACYIYVDYPDVPCGQEVYGSFCFAEGPGQQGDPCDGGFSCAGGHVCVITGSGTQCVELCPLVGPDGCPNGLVCEPIDVEGFGGCL